MHCYGLFIAERKRATPKWLSELMDAVQFKGRERRE